jgi:cell division protein FtsA
LTRHIVCGIDIGNVTLKTVIAEMTNESAHPRIIGIGTAPSNGLRKGIVVDMEEVIESIKKSVTEAQSMSGVTIDHAYVGINGLHIKTQQSKGVVAVARADNEISQSDIDRVMEAASTVSLPQNHEVIHVIPKSFIIDSAENVKSPLGMKGIRLEAEVLIIEGLSPYVHNLTKCINANNIEVAELIFAPLAAAKSVLDKHQREYGVMLLDIGGGVTSMATFFEGDLVHTAVLPVGSRHVTNDLAIAFRTTIDSAEEIKRNHGFVGNPEVQMKKTQVDLSEIVGEEGIVVSRKQIGKIIDARIGELFDVVSAELNSTQGNLPAGAVLAGGGANLLGIRRYGKGRLGLSTKVGGRYNFEGLSETALDPAFAVAVGLVMWGFEDQKASNGESPIARTPNVLKNIGKWFKNFIP